jgi:hypothetical protein
MAPKRGLHGLGPTPFLWLRPCLSWRKQWTIRNRINLQEPWEVDHWTKELGVSKDELQKAIKKVGNSAEAVRKELLR